MNARILVALLILCASCILLAAGCGSDSETTPPLDVPKYTKGEAIAIVTNELERLADLAARELGYNSQVWLHYWAEGWWDAVYEGSGIWKVTFDPRTSGLNWSRGDQFAVYESSGVADWWWRGND